MDSGHILLDGPPKSVLFVKDFAQKQIDKGTDMGFDAFNSIGGPGFTEKEMVIIENSAHEGYMEEEELFKNAFRQFVNKL